MIKSIIEKGESRFSSEKQNMANSNIKPRHFSTSENGPQIILRWVNHEFLPLTNIIHSAVMDWDMAAAASADTLEISFNTHPKCSG